MLLCNFQCQQKKKITGVSQCIELRASSSVVIVFWAGWAEQIRKKKHRVEFFQHYLLSLLLLLLSHFSRVRLCNPTDGSQPGSPVPEILQARTLEWVAISFSNAWKWKVKVKSLSHVRPSATPRTSSLVGSSIHGIFQARVLEWGAIAFSILSLAYSNIFRRYSPKSQPPLNNTYVPSMTTAKIYRINYNFINFLIH